MKKGRRDSGLFPKSLAVCFLSFSLLPGVAEAVGRPAAEATLPLMINGETPGKPMSRRPDVAAPQQDVKVKGHVADANGDPVVGASVLVKGTAVGVITDIDGNFELNNVPPEAKVLKISYIGMKSREIRIAPHVKVVMEDDINLLNEVEVVVAYGTAKKTSLTGAISSVDSKQIEKRTVSNVAAALEGAAPGIQVNNTTGQPGESPTIRIRGISSVNGVSDPLYVIDGVTFDGSVSDLNPADIESISVLKDAASAALYGNRASNGVILITTKKGKMGKTNIRLSVNHGFYSRGVPEYDTVGPYDFMETVWTGYRNYLMTDPKQAVKYPTAEAAGAAATKQLIPTMLNLNIFNQPDDKLFDADGKLVPGTKIKDGYLGDLDWYEPVERTGHRQEYNISGDGANDKGSYYFSLGYLKEEGYIKFSDFERITGRSNVTLTPRKWIKTGLNMSGSYQKGHNTSTINYRNPFLTARIMSPIYPVHLHDAATGDFVLDEEGNKMYDDGSNTRYQLQNNHMIWENELNKNSSYRQTLDGQAFIDLSFLKDFTFSLRGTLNTRTTESRDYTNAIIGDGVAAGARADRSRTRNKSYTFQQQLTWRKLLNEKHLVDIFLSHENYALSLNSEDGGKGNEIFAGEEELSNFTDLLNLNGTRTDYKIESYLGRLKYNYKEKYYAELSVRRDGSSRFAKDKRWGNFWSAGGSWLASEEEFIKRCKFIDMLKLRASYGEVGNDMSAEYYGYMALYDIYSYMGDGATFKAQSEAPDLKWETTSSLGIALEATLFNRLNFSVEYFDKRSQNLIFDVTLPPSTGGLGRLTLATQIKKNIGSVSNRGWELNADVDIIKRKDLNWNVGMNATFMTNKIRKLPEENRANGILYNYYKIVEGGGMFDYWLFKYEGVDRMTGQALYRPNLDSYYIDRPGITEEDKAGKTQLPEESLVSINGKHYTTNTTYAKKDWSGSAFPDVYGSVSTSVRWKDLTLSVLGTYSIGGKVLDFAYNSLMTMSLNGPHALHKDILKSWNGVPENVSVDSRNRIDKKGIPAFNYAWNDQSGVVSDRSLKNGSYFVIKNISLNYALPRSFVKKMDLDDLSLTASVENLASFTSMKGLNPQQSFNGSTKTGFVTPRIISFGVNIKL